LGSSVNNLNLNSILGLFTWSDDPAFAHREIDVECSRWGNSTDINDAQFVVQPYDTAGHLVRYAVLSGQTNSTHLFTWETNRISFQSQKGSYDSMPSPGNIVTNWIYGLDVPQSGDENIRINLWLNNGNSPLGNTEVEFVIKSFQFAPLGQPQPVLLTNPKLSPDGQFHFTINGQMDRRYQIESSTNLLDWVAVAIVLSTNSLMDYAQTNGPGLENRFVRAVTLP